MTDGDWVPAGKAIESEHFETMAYRLPDGTLIVEGDLFWWVDHSYQIEVTGFKTLLPHRVSVPSGIDEDDGTDCIFYDANWEPPEPNRPTHYTDDISYIFVSKFTELLANDELLEHRENGLPRNLP